jgi:hypothetical protein
MWGLCRGILANQSEYDWTNYEGNFNEICPVLHSWLGGLINIYPRAEPATEQDVDKYYDQMKFKTPSDTKHFNFGWLNGHFVWLDFDTNWNDCRGHFKTKRCTT